MGVACIIRVGCVKSGLFSMICVISSYGWNVHTMLRPWRGIDSIDSNFLGVVGLAEGPHPQKSFFQIFLQHDNAPHRFQQD